MGCPPDHRVPSLHPGHPISTMMPLAYFWVSQMLLLQSAVPLSGGDTTNKMTDLFNTWTTLFMLAIIHAHVGLYQYRRWSSLATIKCLQLQEKLVDYIVQWVDMYGIPSSGEDRCTIANSKPPPPPRDVNTKSQHSIFLKLIYIGKTSRSCPLRTQCCKY